MVQGFRARVKDIFPHDFTKLCGVAGGPEAFAWELTPPYRVVEDMRVWLYTMSVTDRHRGFTGHYGVLGPRFFLSRSVDDPGTRDQLKNRKKPYENAITRDRSGIINGSETDTQRSVPVWPSYHNCASLRGKICKR